MSIVLSFVSRVTPVALNVRGKWKANDRKQEYIRPVDS